VDQDSADEGLLDPEEAERRISAFISEADQLAGRPVAELGREVMDAVRRAWDEAVAVLDGQPHDKLLAAQLWLGQLARSTDATDDEHWRLHAASTLLSGMIVPS
jgi:hypothetical protein